MILPLHLWFWDYCVFAGGKFRAFSGSGLYDQMRPNQIRDEARYRVFQQVYSTLASPKFMASLAGLMPYQAKCRQWNGLHLNRLAGFPYWSAIDLVGGSGSFLPKTGGEHQFFGYETFTHNQEALEGFTATWQ